MFVIGQCGKRKMMYDFILVFNSNFTPGVKHYKPSKLISLQSGFKVKMTLDLSNLK